MNLNTFLSSFYLRICRLHRHRLDSCRRLRLSPFGRISTYDVHQKHAWLTLFIIRLKVEVLCVLFLTQPVCMVPNHNSRNLNLQADDKRCRVSGSLSVPLHDKARDQSRRRIGVFNVICGVLTIIICESVLCVFGVCVRGDMDFEWLHVENSESLKLASASGSDTKTRTR